VSIERWWRVFEPIAQTRRTPGPSLCMLVVVDADLDLVVGGGLAGGPGRGASRPHTPCS